jgi:hypothetical protein
MIEVFYLPPTNASHEARLLDIVTEHGGRLDYREGPELGGHRNVCLTYEFDELGDAEQAAAKLRAHGEHVEGPNQYS